MRHSTTAMFALLAASALVTACGNADDSSSRSAATGGDASGGAATGARAGATTGEGGSQVATGGRSRGDGGSPSDGGAATGGAEASGGTATGGRAPTGGATAGGGGGSATGGDSGGGSGGSTGGQLAGAAGSVMTGGAPAGGQGGAATGGAPAGGAATGGDGGTGPIGGTGTLCGVEICTSGEACCGPVECGTCIPELSGQFCPDTCPTGTGGAGGVCPTDYAVPDLDRTCTTAADCFLGAHWADCCGSRLAVSFANSELDAFTAVEAACSPACACPESAPLAEDGSQLTTITSAIAECIDGQCLARGPEHAGTCLTSDVCINTNDGGDCTDAPGPQGAGICRGGAGVCFYCECAAPDTPVATPSGERPIAELRVGDLVYSVEDEAIVIVPIERVNRRRVERHQVVEVRLEGGSVLHISAGHPTADSRTFADLSAGTELDGERILSAEIVPYAHAYTHDILPDSSTGTYFAGGVQIGSTLRRMGVEQ